MRKEQAATEARKLLLQGHTPEDIADYLKKEGARDPRRAIREAITAFEALAKIPPEARLGFCQDAARELYRKCLEVGDYAAALKALRELATLTDSYTAAKEAREKRPQETPATNAPPAPQHETPADVGALLQLVRGRADA